MADVSLLIQSGYKPKKEWLESHFKVDLADEEDFQAAAPQSNVQDAPEGYDPEADGDLYDKVFGSKEENKPFGDEEITEDETVSMGDDEEDDLYDQIFG